MKLVTSIMNIFFCKEYENTSIVISFVPSTIQTTTTIIFPISYPYQEPNVPPFILQVNIYLLLRVYHQEMNHQYYHQ